MKQKIIEVTNDINWGKFMLLQFDEEWQQPSNFPLPDPLRRPLMAQLGWDSSEPYLWVLDLQTGEGAFFKTNGLPAADLHKHRIWVCPMYEPFLEWLYRQDVRDLSALPDFLDLKDAPPAMYGYRREGPHAD